MPQPGVQQQQQQQHQPYPPYPVHNQSMGAQSYPMVGAGPPEHMNPPSYDQVVTAEPYQKQAPYNPDYSAR